MFSLGPLVIEGLILYVAYYVSRMFLKGASLYCLGAILGLIFLYSAMRTLRFITI